MNAQLAIFLVIALSSVCLFGAGSAEETVPAISVGGNGAKPKPLILPILKSEEQPSRVRRAHDKPPYLPRPTPPRPIH